MALVGLRGGDVQAGRTPRRRCPPSKHSPPRERMLQGPCVPGPGLHTLPAAGGDPQIPSVPPQPPASPSPLGLTECRSRSCCTCGPGSAPSPCWGCAPWRSPCRSGSGCMVWGSCSAPGCPPPPRLGARTAGHGCTHPPAPKIPPSWPRTYPACGQHTRCRHWESRWTRCLRGSCRSGGGSLTHPTPRSLPSRGWQGPSDGVGATPGCRDRQDPHLACGPCGSGSCAPRPPSRIAGGRRRCCRCRSRAGSAPPARWPGSCPRAAAGR